MKIIKIISMVVFFIFISQTVGAGKVTNEIQWSDGSHKFIGGEGFDLSGLENIPVGTDRIVHAPEGENPSWTTTINQGDTIREIIVNHICDPDGYTLGAKYRGEHYAIPNDPDSIAPQMAQKMFNDAIAEEEVDLKWLYVAWGLHYLTDSGNPMHTSPDFTIQVYHLETEAYVESKTQDYTENLTEVERTDISGTIAEMCSELAESSSSVSAEYAEAWREGDLEKVDELNIALLEKNIQYVADAIADFETMQEGEASIPTITWTQALFIIMATIFIAVAVKIYIIK